MSINLLLGNKVFIFRVMHNSLDRVVSLFHSMNILEMLFFIFVRFTIANNYNTKAKEAWKYITTLRLTLNIETQVCKNCYKTFSYKSS